MSESRNSSGEVRVGDWILVAELNLLRRAGQEVRLEPRHADLLAFMSTRGGEVVSTEDIIQNVWHGQVVTDHSVYQAIAKLRKAFADSASQPRYIETVPKRGYRLIAEVSEIAAEGQPDDPAGLAAFRSPQPELESPPGSIGAKRHRMFAVFAMLVVLLAVSWFFGRQAGWGEPEYQTVAVLPFAALSEPDDDRLIAEGFSIELANALGHSERMRVIGPISARLASTLGDSPPEIGRHLDADVVVNGSIRRGNENLTVSGVITEVETGHRLWSDVFDRSADDVLAIQREVADAIAGALWHTVKGDVSAPQPYMQPNDRGVYDNYLLGRYYRSQRTQGDLQRALGYFGNALKLDAEYVPAIRGMAAAHLLLSFYGDETLSDALENAQPFLEHALALAPDDAELQALIGLSHYLKGAPGLAEESLMRAVAIHPNLVEAWMWLGLARQQQDRLRDALAPLDRASNLEPLMVTSAVNKANELSWLGRGDEAIALLDDLASTANETFGNRSQLYRVLSSINRSQGNLYEAHTWATRALDVGPESALSKANMAVTLGSLGQYEQAAELARVAYEQSAPGRGVMDYLTRGSVVSPGILPKDLIEARLAHLQHLPGIPEIEWRMAHLHVGMLAYFDGELGGATEHLHKALDGRTYPVTRADDDVFVCISLADALHRSDRNAESVDLLDRCEEEMSIVSKQGWNTGSLAISRVRLAIMRGDQHAADQLLEALFGYGFRNQALMLSDPILKRLETSEAYQRLHTRVVNAIEADWKTISGNAGA